MNNLIMNNNDSHKNYIHTIKYNYSVSVGWWLLKKNEGLGGNYIHEGRLKALNTLSANLFDEFLIFSLIHEKTVCFVHFWSVYTFYN